MWCLGVGCARVVPVRSGLQDSSVMMMRVAALACLAHAARAAEGTCFSTAGDCANPSSSFPERVFVTHFAKLSERKQGLSAALEREGVEAEWIGARDADDLDEAAMKTSFSQVITGALADRRRCSDPCIPSSFGICWNHPTLAKRVIVTAPATTPSCRTGCSLSRFPWH